MSISDAHVVNHLWWRGSGEMKFVSGGMKYGADYPFIFRPDVQKKLDLDNNDKIDFSEVSKGIGRLGHADIRKLRLDLENLPDNQKLAKRDFYTFNGVTKIIAGLLVAGEGLLLNNQVGFFVKDAYSAPVALKPTGLPNLLTLAGLIITALGVKKLIERPSVVGIDSNKFDEKLAQAFEKLPAPPNS